MTVTIANTNLVDSFNTWRLNTNLAATTISNNVVTVTKTGAARGGTTQGDGHIKGTFSANDLRSSTIRGGNTTNQSAITLHSNTTIEARTFTINANTEFTGNVNFTTTGDDRIILGDISRIRVTGGSSGEFLRRTATDTITASAMGLRQISDLSSNSAHLILSSSNTAFSEENNTPDLRFSAGPSGQDVFRVYGDGDSTAGNSDLLIELVSADADSSLKIQTSANNTVHTFGADGNFQSTGRLTTVGITTSGTILPSGGSVNIGSGSAKFEDGNFSGVVTTDKLSISDTSGDGVTTNFIPATHNAKDLGNTNQMWRNFFSSGTATLNNVTIGGTLGTTGDLTAVNLITTGNVDLGNATTDTITATGQFDSNLIPSTDNARDLGSSSKEWKDLYLTGVGYIDELSIGTSAGQGVSTSLIPKTDAAGNLGSATREWNNLFIDGTAKIDTLTVDENATITGTLNVTNTTTLSTAGITTANITTLNASGLASLDGGIDVDGAFTVADSSGNMATTGTATVGGLANLDGGIAVDTNKFTVADTSGNVATAGTLTVTGATTLNGAVTLGDNSSDVITMNGTIAGNPSYTSLAISNNLDIGDGSGTDLVTINALVDSNFIPETTKTHSIGSASKKWLNLHATNLVANNVTLGASGEGAGNSFTINGDITLNGTLTQSSGQTISAPAGAFTTSTVSTLLNVTGSADLGSDASDTVSINGLVDTNIIPSADNSVDLGATGTRWRHIYAHDITITDDFEIGDDLTVKGALDVDDGATVNTLTVTGASSLVGDVDIDGAITRDGGNVLFDTNGILNSASIASSSIASGKLADVVTGASVGSATAVPVITFNNKGQITSATTTSVAGVSGFAFDSANKRFRITTQAGTNLDASIASGSITSNELDTITGLTVQEYGSATEVPIFSVDAKGRITAASEVAVAGISSVGYTSANNNVRISTGDGKTHDLTIADATASVKGVASFTNDFTVSSGAVSLADTVVKTLAGDSGTITPSSHSFTIAGTSNEIETSASGSTLTVGLPNDVTVGNDLTVSRDLDVTRNVAIGGNLTVTGTTTTVNSTTVSIKDPIFELGEDSSDDNLDRGIIMRYNNSGAKKAFMGYDDSASKFVMISDATDTASVITGTAGTLVANIEGNVTGNVSGNVSGNISSGGTSTFATVDINGGTIDGTNIGASSAGTGAFTTISASGNITGNLVGDVTGDVTGNVTGNVSGTSGSTTGNAATATKLASPATIGGASFDGSSNIDVKVKTTSEGSSASEHFLTFVDNTTNDSIVKDIKEDADLTYVPQTGTLTSAIVSAGTNFLGNTLKNTDNRDVITKTADTGVNNNIFHGTAAKANQLAEGKNITIAGAVSGFAGFDGSQAITISVKFPSGSEDFKVQSDDIGDDQVTADHIADNSITHGMLQSKQGGNAPVERDNILNDAVGPNELDDGGDFEMNSLKAGDITLSGSTISDTGAMAITSGGDITLQAGGEDIIFKANNVSPQFGGISKLGGQSNIVIRSGTSAMIIGNGAKADFQDDITVSGTITASGDITAFGTVSDITLKENIQPIENALDKVSKIRGVTFNYIDKPDVRVPGVIAQELQEVLPEAVYETENGKLAVRYDNTIALLLEAIKELKKEVEELKGK